VQPPTCLPYEAVAAARGERFVPEAFASLWATGTLQGLGRPSIAIVGTRAATPYGKRLARSFAAELGVAGCSIVSGLALGIDAAAHAGALDADAPTIGILGGGHDAFFPRRNAALAERIIERGGAVLSPYPPEREAKPWQFLERNAVVAALSDAIVVIEAPARSGALNTAGWAAGRIPVFAVPGDVDRAHVAGCHALIRDGAILARCAQDVLDDLRLSQPGCADGKKQTRRLEFDDEVQRRIAGMLSCGELGVEEIAAACAAPAAAVFAALSLMEIGGVIEALPGRRYVLR
jgi:DNA processing protein